MRIFITFTLCLFIVLTSQANSEPKIKTYNIKGFILEGFVDEPEHKLQLSVIKRQLIVGLKKYKYRLSVNQMHYFAEYLTTLYKNKGLLFHKVIVPPQEIKKKRLRLKLVPGILGDINVRDNSLYSSDRIKLPFLPLLKKPISKEKVEEALLMLNDSPGLNVFSFFSRGKEKNETRINIKVQEENRFNAIIKADNYGVESTGKNRLLTQFAYNNPFGRADQISFGVLASNGSVYGSLGYQAPLWNPFHTFSVSISNNEFDLAGDFSSLGVEGATLVARFDINHILSRGYQSNKKLSWYFDKKDSSLKNSAGYTQLDKDEKSNGVGINTLIDSMGDGYQNRLYLNAYSGQYKSGFSTLNGERFDLANLVVSSQYNLISNDSYFHSKIGLLFRLQKTSDALPSYEKFSLTGIDGVRALESGIVSTDNGKLARLSWHSLNTKWLGDNAFSKNTRLTLFYDWAEGNNSQSSVKESASGLGVLLNFALAKNLNGQVLYASTNDLNISTLAKKESSYAYAELVYRF